MLSRPGVTLLLCAALCATAGAGCKRDRSESKNSAAQDTNSEPTAGQVAHAPGDHAERPRPSVTPIPEEQARGFIDTWLAAQNSGDFTAYETLYAADMTGIRRSGDKTVRLRRDAWMDERGRMFRRPMVVTLERFSFVMRDSGLHAYFTQSFASGSYKDAGRKVLVLARAPGPGHGQGEGTLVIRYEEMLDSEILPAGAPPKPSIGAEPPRAEDVELVDGLGIGSSHGDALALAFVSRGRVVLTRLEDDIGTGPVRPIEVNIDKLSGIAESAEAERTLAISALPPRLARVPGLALRLYDEHLSVLCEARVSREWTLLASDWLSENKYRESAVAQLWAQGSYHVLASLEGAAATCLAQARFAREAALPDLRPPATSLQVPDKARALLQAEIDEMAADDHHHGDEPPALVEQQGDWRVHPAKNQVVATVLRHVMDSCATQESFEFSAWLATLGANGFWDFRELFRSDQEETLWFATDVDGDGAVEIVTSRGVFVAGGEYQPWLPDLRVFWPPGVACDGCEGDDC